MGQRMVTFDFSTAQRIVFGAGRLAELGALAARLGRRAALVTGGHSLEASGRLAGIEDQLRRAGMVWSRIRIEGEPTVETIDAAAAEAGKAGEAGVELVIAVGGGSVLDAGKALAALLANGGRTLDYLEGVGRGKSLEAPARPVIAVPTTAGTGSEATKNAVIGDAAHTFKRSMRYDGMLPAVALVDPELTYDCPPRVTAACGMDAVTQLLESFVSSRAGPLTDALAERGLRVAAVLERLIEEPGDRAAREAMALGSLLGGVCLANAGLGAVHGLAAPLGALFPIAHGAVCAALLPAVVRANAARARATAGSELIEKYRAGARWLTGEALEPEALAERLAALHARAGLKRLGELGVRRDDIARIVAGARGNSMKTNPVALADEELERVLKESL
jgi:alcohol dehydrogenase